MSTFLDKFTPYSIKINGVQLPNITLDEKLYKKAGLEKSATNEEFLRAYCYKRFKEIGLDKVPNTKEYRDRFKYEFDIIQDLGYIDYLLLVFDTINFAKENGIAVGVGRGSSAASLIMYLLGVTGVDPIPGELYFERFISRSRAKKTVIDGVTYFDGSLLCDVDTDFDYYRRKEVIGYVHNKYPNRVSKILTTTTLQGKIALKECAKICGNYEEFEVAALADSVETKFGKVDKISEAFEKSDYLKAWLDEPRAQGRALSNRRIYEITQKIEGLPKGYGVHASAIAVTYDNIDDTCPLQKTKEGELVSGYDMKWMAEISVKLDILGLKTLSVIDEVCKKVNIKMSEIDFDKPEIYESLQDFKSPHGIFQLEADSQGMAARQMKPSNIGELSDILAIARPGAMAYLKDYIKVKNGQKEIPKVTKEWDEILTKTKGVCIFQEQIMKIGSKVFGFTLDEAEQLRRCVSKKRIQEMAEWKPRVYEKAKEKSLDIKVADAFWKLLEDNANYGFAASHARSYAIMCAYTLYLKSKYPSEFYAALLAMATHESDAYSEIAKITQELPHFDIKLLPPNLAGDNQDFAIEGKNIRFGLSAIKGMPTKALEKIRVFKGEFPTKISMFKAVFDAGVGIAATSALIMAGLLDAFVKNRPRGVLEAQIWNLLTEKEKKMMEVLAPEYGDDVALTYKEVYNKKRVDEKGKPFITDKRYATMKKNAAKYWELFNQNKNNAELCNWFFERKLLGFSPSGSLFAVMDKRYEDLINLEFLNTYDDGDTLTFAGIITEIDETKSKKGDKMLKITAQDSQGTVKCIFYGDKYVKWKDQQLAHDKKFKLPEEDDIIILKGQKKQDCIFLQNIYLVEERVFLKSSQIRMKVDEEEVKNAENPTAA